MLNILVLAIQIITAVTLVVLMAIQTDKQEQGGGGVMGLGAASGRMSGNINLPVGAERILKPLTTWTAIGFLFSCVLNAIRPEKLTVFHLLGAIVIYLFVMIIGPRLWKAFTSAL